MSPGYPELRSKCIEAAKSFYEASYAYYEQQAIEPTTPTARAAAVTFRARGEEYKTALCDCELHLLSVERDIGTEEELTRVRTILAAVTLLLIGE